MTSDRSASITSTSVTASANVRLGYRNWVVRVELKRWLTRTDAVDHRRPVGHSVTPLAGQGRVLDVPEEYDKLVRDDIPAIVRENDETPETRRVDGVEYRDYLAAKLREEAAEFADSRDVEELADVLEVVRAIREERDVDAAALEEIREEKAAERGGFTDGVVLERVER